jgi:hypothetical protein
VRQHVGMPVPNILAWSDDADSPVGCEYVIMDHAEGIELRQLWFQLDSTVQLNCIVKITEKMADMTRLEFPAYGSLYMRNSSAVESEKHISIDEDFCVGPSCSKTYWDCAAGESRYYDHVAPDRGPCKSYFVSRPHVKCVLTLLNVAGKDLPSFIDSLINAGLSRIPPSDGHDRRAKRRHQGTVLEHRNLLHSTRKVLHNIQKDARIRDNAAPILVHPDLHMSNIFVDPKDPTKITSIIDWQSASIEPVFMYPLPILNFALPTDYLAYIEEKEKGCEMTTPQIWDAALKACLHIVPKFGPLMQTDSELFGLFRTCHRTWRDGTPLLASDLIDLADRWQDLGLPGKCSYTPPTGDELEAHKTRWTWFEDFQRFRQVLGAKLMADNDGWVPAERWEETQKLHREIFDDIIAETKKPDTDMTEEDWRAIWPYDTPY